VSNVLHQSSRFILVIALSCVSLFAADDKPRVFITDSQSWEIIGAAGGSSAGFAAATRGGARPQTAEIIKTFGERCPQVTINNKMDRVEYVVVLDHEGGKGFLRHRNKVAVFNAVSGDSIAGHSTLSLGGSVQDACEAIAKDWSEHSADIRAAQKTAEAKAPAASTPLSAPTPDLVSAAAITPVDKTAKVSISSNPDGADIEVDGNFVGNTPSTIDLASGDHVVSVKKSGYKPWERKVKTSGGDIRLHAEMEKQ